MGIVGQFGDRLPAGWKAGQAAVNDPVRDMAAGGSPAHRRRLGPWLLGLVLFAQAASAQAQGGGETPSESLPVTQRPRPAYDPLGLHLGSFYIYPSLRVEGMYDDNALARNDDRRSDFATTVSPQVRVRSDFSRHLLGAEAGAIVTRYAQESTEDSDQFFVRGNGRYDVNRDLNLAGRLEFLRLQESREDPEDLGRDQPSKFNRFGGYLQVNRSVNRLRLSLGGGAAYLDYLPSGDQQSDNDRDRTDLSLAAKLSYAQSPRLSVFVGTQLVDQRYDAEVDRNGVERDRTQVSLTNGLDIDFTNVLFGEVFYGIGYTTFADSAFEARTAFVFGANLTWNVTELTTIQVTGERDFGPTTLSQASVDLRTILGVRVDHELFRNVIVGASAGYRNSIFEGSQVEDDEYRLGGRVSYLMNRKLTLDARYDFSTRSSTAAEREFDRNRFTLGLTLHL